jgi:hypothetical protein
MTLVAAVVAVLLGPATGLAAQPIRGGQYAACTPRSCDVVFRVTRDGRYVSGFFAAVRCRPSRVLNRIAIHADGTFRLDATRGAVRARIRGRFTSRSRATGTVRFRHPGCDSGAVGFNAGLE